MRILIILTLCIMPKLSMAQIPVTDAASLKEQVAQGLQLLEQLEQAEAQYNAITGGRGMGNVLNTAIHQEMRRTLPDDWNALMDAARNGNSAGMSTAAASILEAIDEQYKLMDGDDFAALESNAAVARSWENNSATTRASMGIAEAAYNRGTDRLNVYEGFLSEINSTPDTKASIDLLARISAENGILMNEMMRLQAATLQLQSSGAQKSLSLDARARKRHKNQTEPKED